MKNPRIVSIKGIHGSILLVMLLVLEGIPAPSIPVTHDIDTQINTRWGGMPLYFIANRGQTDNQVAYYVQGSDKTLYFTPQGITFALTSPTSNRQLGSENKRHEQPNRWNVKLDFMDANTVQPRGREKNETVFSYFKGTPEQWHTGLPTYSNIIYPNLWEGIDLVFSGTVHRLKYEFIVHPGADPLQIRLAYRGADVYMNETGQLEVSTPAGEFKDQAPIAYQVVDGKRIAVSAAFAFEVVAAPDGDFPRPYGFHLGAYDPNLPLVIDPEVLVYCGYIGGTSGDGDFGTDIAVDSSGNAYITGYAYSTEASFPVKIGPDLSFNGIRDAFVAKIKADGTGLVYAGYIGGDSYDYGYGIAVDLDGNAYVTGSTESTEATFPVTVGPDLTFNNPFGYRDAFVVKVNPAGTDLVYAGYIGGAKHDSAAAITLDSLGNAYVTGYTQSNQTTFPVSVGPDLTHNGFDDVFVAKVKADGTGLVYAGYIGSGSDFSAPNLGLEYGAGIAVDHDGSAYVTGYTSSGLNPAFPVTIGPDLTYNGGPTTSPWDGFVAKVAADGSGLVYCGFIGGAEQDYGTGIAVDEWGNAYVTGYTDSSEATFPVLVGPDLTYNGDYWDAFVTKVKPDGSGFLYSGYIGGDQGDTSQDIVVDAFGNAYIAGGTSSTQATFPVIGGPDLTHNGYDDAFVAKIISDGTQLLYAGYIGGSSGENAHGIAIDSIGNVYVTGDTCTKDGTFPVIVGPDLTFNGTSGYDAFVAKISTRAIDTFTVKSSSAYDGWVLEKTETSKKGGSKNNTSTTLFVGDNTQDRQYRVILSFGTAGIPDNAVITKVILKVKKAGVVGTNPMNTHNGLVIDIRKNKFYTLPKLQIQDFQAKANKVKVGKFPKKLYSGWYSAALYEGATPYINLKGTTQFRLRFLLDDDDDNIADILKLYSGNAIKAYRPQLIVEYYVP